MTRTELRKEWETRIADFKASGESATTWCTARHLKIHQFYYWVKKCSSSQTTESPSPKWLSIEVDRQPEESMNGLLIRVGQAIVEVKPGFDPALLADVMQTLKGL